MVRSKFFIGDQPKLSFRANHTFTLVSRGILIIPRSLDSLDQMLGLTRDDILIPVPAKNRGGSVHKARFWTDPTAPCGGKNTAGMTFLLPLYRSEIKLFFFLA